MWTSKMEKKLTKWNYIIRLKKAFNLVDTDILLKKLLVYECDKNNIAWLKSYLQHREQCAQFKGKISDTKPVTNGVPQEIIVCPLLFIVFMNDMLLCVDLSLDMYADDSTLGASGKIIEDLEVKLNLDMTKVNKWCKDYKMALNCDKAKVMLIITYQKEAKLDSTHLSVICDNTELENVNSNKLLGVIIDKNLTWTFHIDKITKSISCDIALSRRIRKYLPDQPQITFLQKLHSTPYRLM